MKKLTAIIMIICILTLVGCTNSTQALVGSWKLVSGNTDVSTIIFYSDGSCLVDNDETGNWSVVDGTLKVLGPIGGMFWFHDNIIGTCTLKSDRLIITDALIDGDHSETLIYERD